MDLNSVGPVSVCAACGEAMPFAGPEGGCPRCMFATGCDPSFGEAPDDAMTCAVPPSTPLRFGHFEIVRHPDGSLRELGRGAMGLSYLAHDNGLDCQVALKVIDARLSTKADARARFLREARAAAKLRHPNVASVFHYGEEGHQCFYAMELVEGETLETRVRREGALPPALALGIVTQVAHALVAADACGIVHRDLKPSNLMLANSDSVSNSVTETPMVKVIDFGLAKAVAAAVNGAEWLAPDLTHAGFVGTPAFASPEQFATPLGDEISGRIDTRSDIYSLGVTLWYSLTGKVPFVGRSLAEIYDRQIHRPLPLEHLTDAHVPECLISLLCSVLAADPAERPQSPRELAEQLHRCQAEIESPPRAIASMRWKIGLVAGVTLCVVAAAWFFARIQWTAGDLPPLVPSLEKSVAVLPFENLSEDKSNLVFADGIQDDVITALTRIRDLKVIGRASVMGYRGVTGLDKLREIGRALSVTSLLEGTVRRTKERVIVSARLIDPRDGHQIWGETYDRAERDALSVQGEVARAIAGALHVTLSPEERARLERRPTNNADAYALYLGGQMVGRSRTVHDVRQAQTLFEQAVKLDPAFALAWAKLSLTHSRLYSQRTTPITPAEFAAAALTPAQTALRLQPDLAEAHLALAAFHDQNREFEAAVAANQEAIRLAPNDGTALGSLADTYGNMGREAEARSVHERATVLSPQDATLWKNLATSSEILRDWPAAARAYDRTIALEPESFYLRFKRAWLEIPWKADLEPVRAFYRDLPASAEGHVWIIDGRGQLALYERDYDAAEKLWTRAIDILPMINAGVIRYAAFYRGKARLARNSPGDAARAREDFERALPGYRAMIEADPNDGESLAELSEVLACLERGDEARAFAALALAQIASGDLEGKPVTLNLARTYARLGDTAQALPLIEHLLAVPSKLEIQNLRLHLDWDPIRADSRFQSILRRGN